MVLPFEKVDAFKVPYSRVDFIQLGKRRSFLFTAAFIFFLILFLRLRYTHGDSTRDALQRSRGPHDPHWEYPRDAKKYTLDGVECNKAFPGLFIDIDRAFRDRNGAKVTLEELDNIPKRNGYVRGMVYDQELYVLDTHGGIYSRSIATLLALHRAILTSPDPLPNIEFVFSTDDWLPPSPQWAYARQLNDRQTWLMPDFGFYSWPETKVGSYGEVQSKAIAMEETALNPSGQSWSWDVKIPQLFWRGATMSLPLRESFVGLTTTKPWADVLSLDWHNINSTATTLKSMDQHCQYKFLAHTEGNSYSGRLKYLQNCRSVIVAHAMDWYQHFSFLMDSNPESPSQNYVQVARNFSDLEATIESLLADDQRAKRIADNNVKTFRERYTTPSAEACYWRKLIWGWRDAMGFEPKLWEQVKGAGGEMRRRGVPVESFVLERRLEWDPY